MTWCAMPENHGQKSKASFQGPLDIVQILSGTDQRLQVLVLLVQPCQNLDGQDEIGRMASGGQCARTDGSLVDWAPIPQSI